MKIHPNCLLIVVAIVVIATLGISQSHASPYVVYKVSAQKKIQFWQENRDNGESGNGVINANLFAYVIYDVGNANQATIYFDPAKKTYSLGEFGLDMAFLDQFGDDPFHPGVEVIRTTYSDSKNNQTEFWSLAARDNGDLLVDENGAVVTDISNAPVFTTRTTGVVWNVRGVLKELKLPDGSIIIAAPSRTGEGYTFITDPTHFAYGYNTDLDENGNVIGIEEVRGRLHVWEATKVKYGYLASFSGLVNSSNTLLDDFENPITPQTDRYAILAIVAELKRIGYTLAP